VALTDPLTLHGLPDGPVDECEAAGLTPVMADAVRAVAARCCVPVPVLLAMLAVPTEPLRQLQDAFTAAAEPLQRLGVLAAPECPRSSARDRAREQAERRRLWTRGRR
jgi:hypothetical protein